MRIMKPVDVVLSFYLAEFDTRTLQGHVISEHAVVVDTRTRSELVELAQTAIQIPAFEYLYHSDAARYPRSSTHVQEWLVGTTGQQRIRSVHGALNALAAGHRPQTLARRSAVAGGHGLTFPPRDPAGRSSRWVVVDALALSRISLEK
jgi:hypothetical protein